jgi:hypothetical protein
MQKIIPALIFVTGLAFTSVTAAADPLAIKNDDTIKSVLPSDGKRVTVIIKSGEELDRDGNRGRRSVVQLGELSGKEFFDAVVDLKKISAVIVRARE